MTTLIMEIEKLRAALLRIQDLAHDLYYWQNLGDAREALLLIDIETRNALPEIWDRPWSNGLNPEEGHHTVDPQVYPAKPPAVKPDIGALREDVMKRLSKTLAFLANH